MLDDGQPRLQQEEDQVTHRFSRRFTGLSGPTVVDDRSWRTVQDVQCRHAGLCLVAGLVLESKFILLNVIVTQVLGGVVTGRQLSSIRGGSGPHSTSPPWSPFTAHTAQSRSPFRSEVEMGSSAEVMGVWAPRDRERGSLEVSVSFRSWSAGRWRGVMVEGDFREYGGDLACILRSDDGRPLQRREGIILKVFGEGWGVGAGGSSKGRDSWSVIGLWGSPGPGSGPVGGSVRG